MNSMKDLVKLISKRDGISENEAWFAVDECVEDIQYLCAHGGNYNDLVNCIQVQLGLEPDYLDIILNY